MDKATVLYGPPGTGKTTRLVKEIQERIEAGVDPARIVVVSYTKAAAKEIAQRVGVSGVRTQTLHSLAYQLAEIIKDQVFAKEWAIEFSKISGIPLTLTRSEQLEELNEGDGYLALYSYARSTLDDNYKDVFAKAGADGSLQKFLYFVKAYDEFKGAYGIVDFSDMLDHALGCDPKADIMVLDEAQDFSKQQWALVESMLIYLKEVIVAGDDDQAIYKWSGADPEGMHRFEQRYLAHRTVLDQSYRIPHSVHELAERLIEQVGGRVPKEYNPREHQGSVVRYGSFYQLRLDPAEDTLVLVRNHALRKSVEDNLISNGVPYHTEGGFPGPLDNHFMRAIRAWIRGHYNYEKTGNCMLTDADIGNLRRCAQNMYKDKLSDPEDLIKKGIHWDRLLYLPRELGVYYRKLRDTYPSFTDIQTKIRISTIHNAKGREADHVVLVNGMTMRTASAMSIDPDSELRTFYVGVTRARDRLSIVTDVNPLRHLL